MSVIFTRGQGSAQIEQLRTPKSLDLGYPARALEILGALSGLSKELTPLLPGDKPVKVPSTERETESQFNAHNGHIGTKREHRALYVTSDGLRVGLQKTSSIPSEFGDSPSSSSEPMRFVEPNIRTALYLAASHSLQDLRSAALEVLEKPSR